MISIEKEDDEGSLVTFYFQFPNPELRELYRNIFTPDYFQALGLHVPEVAGWIRGGGGEEEEEKDKIPPFPYNIFYRFSNLFETKNPLFRYNAEDLMKNDEEEEEEDFNLETAEKLEKEKQEKLDEETKQAQEKAELEKEEKEKLDEETKQAHLWELQLSKHLGSPVLTESEYREMKITSNHYNDLEKDQNGFTTPEKNHLAELDKIQKDRKETILKTVPTVPKDTKYNQSPVFYILPKKNAHYIRLSFAFN